MWNLVKLDGEYYHVDATSATTHGGLLKSDTMLNKKAQDYVVYKKYDKYLDLRATSTLYDDAEWRYTKIPMVFEDEPKAETYTITYVLNGGINNSENPSSYVQGNALTFKDPTREGYEFDGWYLNEDFTKKINALTTRSNGDKTLYAKWNKIETPEEETTPAEEVYTITYVLNGGVNNSENPATYVKGTAVEFKCPTRDGYEFDGWYLNEDFTKKINALTTRSSGDKTLYAKWIKIETPEEVTTEETAETYTITYVLNSGVNSSENPATYVKGTRVEFKDATREGYTFDGWYLDAQFKT